jgi:predicted nucleic acid-binding Zn ribbon protein
MAKAIADPRYSPNDMEREAVAWIAELVPLRNAETDKSKRKALSQRIKSARILRDWARSRAGYVG